MRTRPFSIAGLMGIVLVAAVGLAALLSPSPTWAGAIFMVTCGVFGLAIVGAIYHRGVARATPTSTVSIDLQGIQLKMSLRVGLEQLGLDYRVHEGYLRVTRAADPGELDQPDLIAYGQRWNRSDPVGFSSDLDDPFLIAGHCLLAPLAAGFGAILAPLVADARREPSRRAAAAEASTPIPSPEDQAGRSAGVKSGEND